MKDQIFSEIFLLYRQVNFALKARAHSLRTNVLFVAGYSFHLELEQDFSKNFGWFTDNDESNVLSMIDQFRIE